MKNFLAIDPGQSGGFAWFDTNDCLQTAPMPETDGEVMTLIRSRSCDGCQIIMEQVGGFIAGNPAPGSAMFNFGMGYGFIKGVAMAYAMPLQLVTPQKWQKFFSLGSKKDHGKDWKNHLKQKSQYLYPDAHITNKTADAILILHYANESL